MGVYSSLALEKYNEASMPTTNVAGLLEFAVNAEAAEHKMFDAMLELDFREAYMESGLLTEEEDATASDASDDKKDEEKSEDNKNILVKIKDKIVELFKKFIATVTTFIQKLKLKFEDFFKLNEKLVEKFGDLDAAKIKEGAKDKDIKLTLVSDPEGKFSGEYVTRVIIAGNTYTKKLDSVGGDDGYSTVAEDAKEEFDKLNITDDEFKSHIEEVSVEDYLAKVDLKKLAEDIKGGFKKQLLSITSRVDKAIAECKGEINTIKNEKKHATEDSDRAYWSAYYSITSTSLATFNKVLGVTSTFAVKKASADRKAYAKLGALQKNAKSEDKKEEKTNESVMATMAAIDIVNEEFMAGLFED
jgi:hypothetical protein